MSKDLPRSRLAQPTYLLLELLVQLFTLGIFSAEGGAKAWFELVLVAATLCACGYIVWWQIPLLIIAIILATLAAGMFSILAPQYLEESNVEVNKRIAAALQNISKYNLNNISTLSGNGLEKRLEQLRKAQQIFEKNPKIIEQISELELVFDNINRAGRIATQKVESQREAYEYQQKQRQELKKKHREAQEKRKQEEAELKIKQEKWLYEQRKREKYTGGCPPDNRYDPANI